MFSNLCYWILFLVKEHFYKMVLESSGALYFTTRIITV